MNFLKTCLAVLAGFLLCYVLLVPRSVKAADLVRVTRVSVHGGGTTSAVADANIVGFSCTGSGDDAQCFIASR
jgi:hypothetical protein